MGRVLSLLREKKNMSVLFCVRTNGPAREVGAGVTRPGLQLSPPRGGGPGRHRDPRPPAASAFRRRGCRCPRTTPAVRSAWDRAADQVSGAPPRQGARRRGQAGRAPTRPPGAWSPEAGTAAPASLRLDPSPGARRPGGRCLPRVLAAAWGSARTLAAPTAPPAAALDPARPPRTPTAAAPRGVRRAKPRRRRRGAGHQRPGVAARRGAHARPRA